MYDTLEEAVKAVTTGLESLPMGDRLESYHDVVLSVAGLCTSRELAARLCLRELARVPAMLDLVYPPTKE